MKRLLLSFVILLASAMVANAMGYRKARQYAYFLTDKMAYELNLTAEQYERVYEVNLDYFLSIDHRYDLYGSYWDYRDTDLRYILFDWQYDLFRSINYFFRPLSWHRNSFVFVIYDYYHRPDYFYYDRPLVYARYRGSRWEYRHYDTPSPYRGMVFSGRRGGMRDAYSPDFRGGYDYRNGHEYDNYRNSSSPVYSGRRGNDSFQNDGRRHSHSRQTTPRYGEQAYPNDQRNTGRRNDFGSSSRIGETMQGGRNGGGETRGGSFGNRSENRNTQNSSDPTQHRSSNSPARGSRTDNQNTNTSQGGSVRQQNGVQIVGGRR